jgi:hypothetical protein
MFSFKEYLLNESVVQKVGRKRIVRLRIRKGKVQRNKTFSSVPGYTIRSGKLVRMSYTERRDRRMASSMSKFKRAAKMKQTIRKRKTSFRKRGALGL